ncbi:MAG TPA: LysR substrate-binding domain-containing protein [Microbacteriaceae bacterium]|nr:LysR substrate-binding domain-containing protein [Microbacteriaceae bacterium]
MRRRIDDLEALDVLDAVARCGSMSAAARECRLSQQAVSARIRDIERRVGFALFERSPRGVALTAEGESVVAWSREVLVAAARLDAAVDLMHRPVQHTLTVGGSQTIAAELLPGWLLGLRQRQLQTGEAPTPVRLRTGNSAEVARLVASGELDVGFIESPAVPRRLSSVTVATDRLVAVVAGSHPWAAARAVRPASERAPEHAREGAEGRGEKHAQEYAWQPQRSEARSRGVTLAEVAATPLVTREQGSGTRLAYETAVRERLAVRPADPALVLGTSVAVLHAVAGGVAPAVLSELAVADEAALGRVCRIPIVGDPITRPLTALWSWGVDGLRGAARLLVDLAQQEHDHQNLIF